MPQHISKLLSLMAQIEAQVQGLAAHPKNGGRPGFHFIQAKNDLGTAEHTQGSFLTELMLNAVMGFFMPGFSAFDPIWTGIEMASEIYEDRFVVNQVKTISKDEARYNQMLESFQNDLPARMKLEDSYARLAHRLELEMIAAKQERELKYRPVPHMAARKMVHCQLSA